MSVNQDILTPVEDKSHDTETRTLSRAMGQRLIHDIDLEGFKIWWAGGMLQFSDRLVGYDLDIWFNLFLCD